MPRRLLTAVVMFITLALPFSICAENDHARTGKKPSVIKGSTKSKSTKEKKVARKPVKKVVAAAAPAAIAEKAPLKPAEVAEVRHWSTPDYTRVAITLDREATFEKHEIATSPGSTVLSRIYFDINGARLASGVKDVPIGDGLLKTARVAQYRADTVRVVLDVENIRDYKIFTFSDPFRIIVDVKGERRTEISALSPAIKATVPAVETVAREFSPVVPKEPAVEPPGEHPAPKPKVRLPVKPGKVRRIVVDPGHGGKDPGAVGPSGLQEKEVVLAMGLSLAKKLKDELGIDVVMTRSTDVFIELQERTAIANQVGADLFVSIHANASLNRNASGIETYYLNLAKTEKAAQLAARENGTSLEKVSLLQAVLFDLMANYKLNDSAHLAEEVQKLLHKRLAGRYSTVKNLGVKQGPFYVLVGATMPSILVETAFISNEREETRLGDPLYQEQVAEGIIEGLSAYIAALK
ncbi:MAG TPA: N-acetylmuramoyl-L-alanine amidase [Geobacteraceae bacterium]|nr:N-acetylmuramoyl-L-alanine amidase [Geobacteraceae bacterium]